MGLDEKILARLDELIAKGEQILTTKKPPRNIPGVIDISATSSVDSASITQWAISGLNLLERAFGVDSPYYQKFAADYDNVWKAYVATRAVAILRAAKDDVEKGILFDTRAVIAAEVFADFMEQADHLLQAGYYQPAAVVAGSVLEDGLRKLCDRHSLQLHPNATLTPMNDALAKNAVYTKLAHDQIVPAIRLRNHAAHGQWDEFDKNDAANMLQQVRDFMARHFS